jgi:hypothetical protein
MLRRFFEFSTEGIGYTLNTLQYRYFDGKKNPLRKVLVNGSPKTGTTWMLKLIESIPGYRAVGNFNGSIQRYDAVVPGDVVHGHDWYSPELSTMLTSNGISVILMVRDPRDQQVSRVFHIRRDPKHAWHERLKAVSFDEALMACIEGREGLQGARAMIGLTHSWIHEGADAICVHYEDLLKDTETHLRQVLDYLDIKVSDSMLRAIIAHNRFSRLARGKKFWQSGRRRGQEDPNSHFRKGIAGDWKNYLTDSHIEKFKEVAGEALIELGYERDLNW